MNTILRLGCGSAMPGTCTMPSLAELKSKWFIPMDGSHPDGVPCRRGPARDASPLNVSTDGNTVMPLVDGKDCMRAWRDELLALHGAPDAELYHTGWRFEGVNTLGARAPWTDALEDLVDAAQHGVDIYVLACRNLRCLRFNRSLIKHLRLQGILTACLDGRFPPGGSNHQKFTVMKSSAAASVILGSADIAKTRWDSSEHSAEDPDRDPTYGEQTHEIAANINGPAVADVESTYRERWNDSTSRRGLRPVRPPRSAITTPLSSFSGGGTHSVQVLRTYGITSAAFGYSWSPAGEFTVWASCLNAIKKASSYIYIEDQYFLPFDWPPCLVRTGLARDTDIIYQLGEAMKRGVDVMVVTMAKPTSVWYAYQKYQRDIGVNYLRSVRATGSRGDIVVASLQFGGSEIYVHSKLMLVDDEFVSIGSSNVSQRSLSSDSELQVAVVDEENRLTREFRVKLWAEHSGLPAGSLDDPDIAVGVFRSSVADRLGHLKPYSVDPLSTYPPSAASTPPPPGHPTLMRLGIDPYAGPRNLR